ncbi:premnaspirodiene oxygenase-like [Phragmites australis]|uniref:premnaspirodiene oxygenase-like n=1 Tax=Phragmites australis TaxID=29695 RepID=UPI002D776C99|nr:premnaspirodiene oxygenase-like [Phragmites australis]XP_062215627.1 premnaspirodiene oxygenase-like [Phragmites australis]
MDEYFYQSLLLSVVAVALLQLVKLALRPAAVRLPPGPWELPVIGSMHHLVNVLPHRALRDLAEKHGPLIMLRLGQTPLVVASSKETARVVLKTHDTNFATRPKLLAGEIVGYEWVDILFAPSGDYWRKLRQLCAAEILSPKRVLSFRHIREDEVMLRVEEIRAAGPSTPVNLSVMLHSITNSIVSRATFGKKRKNAPEFLAATKAVVSLASGFNIPDLFPTWTTLLAKLTGMMRSLKEIHKTVDTILEEIIEERKGIRDDKIKSGAENVEENLVDVLIGLQEKGGFGFHLSNSIIKAIILDMFAGGTGTSGSAMEWGMSELVRNPAVMKKLQGQIREAFRGKAVVTEGDLQASNLQYLKLVIKEALRLHPPAPLLVPRESIDVCELEGYTIPAKSRVVINAWAIGRDPKYWDDPEEFKPERFEDGARDFTGSSYEFLPFGSGRRMCPGFNYGLASMELALAGLLYHFDWSLPEGVKEVDMAEAPGLGVRRRTPLILCATPFVPAAASTD